MKSEYKIEVEIIKKFLFPLLKEGEESYRETIDRWLQEQYYPAISKSQLLTDEEASQAINFTKGLLRCFDYYMDSDFINAYSHFKELMDLIKPMLFTSRVGYKNNSTLQKEFYYRVRAEEKPLTKDKMLHVPFNNRKMISTNRFSAPGMPCSYLATMQQIAWYECGMPDIYQLAKFEVREDEHQLICLDFNPVRINREIIEKEGKCGSIITDRQKIDAIKKVYFTLPLIAMCSVVVNKNSNIKFIEEYVVPQMLMSWVKKDPNLVGVRYNSSVDNILVRDFCGYNIAIPAREPDEHDEYCNYLKRLFIMEGKTKTKRTVTGFFKNNNEKIEELRRLNYKLDYQQKRNNYDVDDKIINELYANVKNYVDVCNVVLLLLDELRNNTESVLMCVVFSELENWMRLINEKYVNYKEIYKNEIEASKENETVYFDIEQMKSKLEKIFEAYRELTGLGEV